MAFTYMLECVDGTFYVGSTVLLDYRLHEHREGEVQYTRHRRPIRLVWCEEWPTVAEAFTREKQVQGWSRAKRVALIEQRYGDLPALAARRGRRSR